MLTPGILTRTSFFEFEALARGAEVVALCDEVRGDSETPVSAFRKLRGRHRAFLFESVEGGDRWARHSFLGADPRLTVVQRGDESTLTEGKRVRRQQGKPLEILRSLVSRKVARVPGLPRFVGGLVGYLSYSAVRWLEPRVPARLGPDPDFPDAEWMLFDQLVAFDNFRHRLKLIACADLTTAPSLRSAYRRACEKLEILYEGLRRRLPPDGRWSPPRVADTDDREVFEQGVERVREYIRAGDCMQVVLSRRLVARYRGDPFELYRQLRASQPAPYLYFLDLGGQRALAGASPELLVRVEDRKVTVRPIAGTRPRGRDGPEDAALEQELRGDPKEISEHVMLLDLGRNDVGRVAKPGTVKVVERQVIERYSHVMHLVSEVTGTLRDDLDALDAVASTFPAGTVSGAPKVRAMQIIDELERTPRGPYAGAVGYLGYGGNLDLAIAIRSVALCKHRLRFQAGAGLVHDSEPRTEFEETRHKLRGILQGLKTIEVKKPPRGLARRGRR